MRTISAELITREVKKLVLKANTTIRSDVLFLLKKALRNERKHLAKKALTSIIKNAYVAKKEKLAICQDTGMPVAFIEMGHNVHVKKNINDIIKQAIATGYKQYNLRASIQKSPLLRDKKISYDPAIIHLDIVEGDKLKITLFPKGFGSENKSQVKMLNPTASFEKIGNFIIEAVKTAGAGACPPYFIGVGIGGTQDLACLMAKKALLRSLTKKK